MDYEIQRLNDETERLDDENQRLCDELQCLDDENQHLDDESQCLSDKIGHARDKLGHVKEKFGLLWERRRYVHIRYNLNTGLNRKVVCSKDQITFEDQGNRTSRGDNLRMATLSYYPMSLREVHNVIGEQFHHIINNFHVDAETEEQRETIDAYTLSDVQKLLTLVDPCDLCNLSSMVSLSISYATEARQY